MFFLAREVFLLVREVWGELTVDRCLALPFTLHHNQRPAPKKHTTMDPGFQRNFSAELERNFCDFTGWLSRCMKIIRGACDVTFLGTVASLG